MRAFKFRAQAALQLRRREHDQALVLLARAQAALRIAQRGVEEADRALADADQHTRDAMQPAGPGTPLEWYRSWRVRLTRERQQCEDHRVAHEAQTQQATGVVNSTRTRVRSLERLHDNALAAWQLEAGREDQKTMDALAAIRFTRTGKDSV